MQGLPSISPYLWTPEKARVRQELLIFSPCLVPGTLKNAGVAQLFRPLVGLEKAGVRLPLLTPPPAGIGDPGECRDDVAIPPICGPPRRQG